MQIAKRGPHSLTLLAGERAYKLIRSEGGLDPARIGAMVGASGGPKWLVLSRLDRAIIACWLKGRTAPLPLLGSSIGGWRFACYAQSDPIAAFDRFEAAYLAYRLENGDGAEKIMADSYDILDALLGPRGPEAVFGGPMQLHIMAVRSRGPLASERKALLVPGLVAAALGNLVSRRSLGLMFERALFRDPRAGPGFARFEGFPFREIMLEPGNLREAIMASSAIPVMLPGVADIRGAPAGTYRDGGIIDYHFDLPVLEGDPDRIALMPHFLSQVIPGWFDKTLPWRRAAADNLRALLLIAPSREFVSGLPGGKIPDRSDFRRLDTDTRIAVWNRVLAETDRMADEFRELVEKGTLATRLKPFPLS
ncbi:MAG: hypothetical protein Kow00104_12290 [Rhodothalassiaceae bacterium]